MSLIPTSRTLRKDSSKIWTLSLARKRGLHWQRGKAKDLQRKHNKTQVVYTTLFVSGFFGASQGWGRGAGVHVMNHIRRKTQYKPGSPYHCDYG